MWKSFVNSEALKNVAQSLEKTGEALSQHATSLANKTREAGDPSDERRPQDQAMERLKQGWGNVVNVTRNAVEGARNVVEKEQVKLAARLQNPNQPRKRDPNLPLDVDALQDAEVVYITDRIITMSHPAMQSTVDGDITPARKLAAVGQLLHKRHGGRYMVWNLSEVEYDVSMFDNQVLLFSFPGSPSPPLGLLLKLLIGMESWLKADDRNVAVVHCLTGKGRTSTVVAAFLCWMGEAGFTKDVHKALEYISKCKKMNPDELTIPSQRRYAQYFANMLDGVRPSQPPLMLKRVILSEAPKFAKGPPRDDLPPSEDDANPERLLMGCAPYLQIFKAGQLVFTTAASLHYNQKQDELPFCQVADGTVSFHVENVVQGDILLRCRHLTASGQRVSMFRAAFHTGYVPPNVMRLTKAQLDGACTDKRFVDDFFLDLIFEPCEAEVASKHLSGKADAASEKDDDTTDARNEAEERRGRGTIAGADIPEPPKPEVESAQIPTVTASAYDSMLHRDSRFWDVIAARRQQHATGDEKSSDDPLYGPTIGRRRKFDGASKKANTPSKQLNSQNSFQAFSIGGADFDLGISAATQAPTITATVTSVVPKEEKKDELMEALMAIDDEVASPVAPRRMMEPDDVEEIVFGAEDGEEEAVTPPPAFKAQPVEKQGDSQKEEPEAKEEEEVAATSETKEPAKAAPEKAEAKDPTDEVAALLNDADFDMDTNVDAFLSSAGDDGALNEDFDFDVDDDELEDLENFLSKSK